MKPPLEQENTLPEKKGAGRVNAVFFLKYGLYTGASTQLVGAIVLGLYLGYQADQYWHSKPVGLIIGLLIGIVAGFGAFFKTIRAK